MRKISVVLMMMLVLPSCQKGHEVAPSVVPLPVSEVSNFDGTWNGMTSDNLLVQFKVSGGAITFVAFQYGCEPAKTPLPAIVETLSRPSDITNSAFNVQGVFNLHFSGTFSSNAAVAGSAGVDIRPDCVSSRGPVARTWTATKS